VATHIELRTKQDELVVKFDAENFHKITAFPFVKEHMELIGHTMDGKERYATLKLHPPTTMDEAKKSLEAIDKTIQVFPALVSQEGLELHSATHKIVESFTKILKPIFQQGSVIINERNCAELAMLVGIEKMIRDLFPPNTDANLLDSITILLLKDPDFAEKIMKLKKDPAGDYKKAYDIWSAFVLWRSFQK
jgi:hypothetical protein